MTEWCIGILASLFVALSPLALAAYVCDDNRTERERMLYLLAWPFTLVIAWPRFIWWMLTGR